MQKEQLPSRIKSWLLHRGITEAVIETYEIGWNGEMIVIPIHDTDGKVLFNKYRRDPEVSVGPKYRYEKGGTSELYGIRSIPSLVSSAGRYVVICEGELDCLRLLSSGIPAVTSTGGASTFKEEWASMFESLNTYICFDTDDAGMKGALHVQQIIPHAKIMLLPKGVKDVTEYFLSSSSVSFGGLMANADTYTAPTDWRHLSKKTELNKKKKEYEEEIGRLMVRAREARGAYDYQKDELLQRLIAMYMTKLGEVKRQIKYFQVKRDDIPKDRIAAAKAVPIPTYIKFNREKMAPCIWHNEKTPSMYYYEKQNRVKCFGCNKLGDVIDVVQQINHVGLSEAINIILNNSYGQEK